jgi:Cu/Ag efflux pump CusA
MDDFQKIELIANSRHEELLEEAQHSRMIEGLKGAQLRLRQLLITSTVILLGLLIWWAR